jgi:hypothetical protein
MSRALSRVAPALLVCALVTTASATELHQSGVCMREGAKLAGMMPVRAGKGVPQPRKIHNLTPKYPDLPTGMRIKVNHWVGELLVDSQGLVKQVWATREMTFIPQFPAFNLAIVDAFRQWRFEPVVIQGERVPICVTVTHVVDFS